MMSRKAQSVVLNALVIIAVLSIAELQGAKGETLFCQTVIRPLGYGCTEHTVQTDDGYVLLLHRLSLNLARQNKGNSTGSGQILSSADHSTNRRKTDYDNTTKSQSGAGAMPLTAASLGGDQASTSVRQPSSNDTKINGPSTGNPGAGKGAPVLLMHMEFFNGDSWFMYVDKQHNGKLLPLMLLQDGFDVWVGHQRATFWAHQNVHLQSTQQAFWNWTWDQHAEFDLPAQLRKINSETNQTIHYVGISQAATAGAAGASHPNTTLLMRSLTLIGPTAYRGNTNSVLLDSWAYTFGRTLDTRYYATGFQNGAFNYSSEFPPGPILTSGPAAAALNQVSGPDCCLGINASISFANGWDGTTSFKNLLHWQQGIRSNRWARFDYSDPRKNIIAYGRLTPPLYYPGLIPATLPVLVVYGGRDWTAPPRGVYIFMAQLKRPAKSVFLQNYAHYDLIYSVNRETDVFAPIVSFLAS